MIARKMFDFGSALDGFGAIVAFGCSIDDAIYVVAPPVDEERRDAKGSWKRKRDEPATYKVVRLHDSHVTTTTIEDERATFDHVQAFSNGDLLLVSSRCALTSKSVEKNALIVDREGREISRLTLGDAIADVRVDASDAIWVSYFDEGIFGNYGWSEPGGREAIGARGLVRFDRGGEILFRYDADAAKTNWMADAYALNVTKSGAVFVYFYTEFPIVKIERGEYRVWTLGASGARALAVTDDRALLFGDYENRSAARLVDLPFYGDAKIIAEEDVHDERGQIVDARFVRGIDDRLVFLRDREVLILRDF